MCRIIKWGCLCLILTFVSGCNWLPSALIQKDEIPGTHLLKYQGWTEELTFDRQGAFRQVIIDPKEHKYLFKGTWEFTSGQNLLVLDGNYRDLLGDGRKILPPDKPYPDGWPEKGIALLSVMRTHMNVFRPHINIISIIVDEDYDIQYDKVDGGT